MFVIRHYEFVRLTNQFVLLLIDPSNIVMVNNNNNNNKILFQTIYTYIHVQCVHIVK